MAELAKKRRGNTEVLEMENRSSDKSAASVWVEMTHEILSQEPRIWILIYSPVRS